MDVQVTLVRVLVLIFSVVVHEVAHGWTAMRLGDPTAKEAGRITLNPWPHVSLMGSIIVPLGISLMGGFPYGWAKPVPVNPNRLRNPWDDHPKVAAAGPASNLLLALISAVLLGVMAGVLGQQGYNLANMEGWPAYGTFFFLLFHTGIFINVVLALFNLIPIPPLDGSWVLRRFLPRHLLIRYEQLRRHGMVLVIGIILLIQYSPLGNVLGVAIYKAAAPFLNLATVVANALI